MQNHGVLLAIVLFGNRRIRHAPARDREANYDLIGAAWRLEVARHPNYRFSGIMQTHGHLAFNERAVPVYQQFLREHWREPTAEELLYRIDISRAYGGER